jgi:hypothetical protein
MANGPTSNGGIQGLNKAARLFNAHLKSLVDVGKQEMPGSNLVCQFIQDDQRYYRKSCLERYIFPFHNHS